MNSRLYRVFTENMMMNRFCCTLILALLVSIMAINNVMADYVATFDSDLQGWDGDGPAWVSSGGQDGGYASFSRENACPYLVPATGSALFGDVAGNIGGSTISFSYYLKSISGSPNAGGVVALFADTDATAGWDTLWFWTPSDISVPTQWRQYAWTVDTAAETAPSDWSRVDGSGSWSDSWKNVAYWNFWSNSGSGTIVNGIDTVSVTAVPEPASVMLFITGLLGLMAYAWRKQN